MVVPVKGEKDFLNYGSGSPIGAAAARDGGGLSAGARFSARRRWILAAAATLGTMEAWESRRMKISSTTEV
ncbi:Os12g0203133 [Oryza sativa Japonica Group]|uniref:Os12g0203133 protein n=1 Tax=Oryza sativa subsp. japonica TaxID=39947 RepID=A0A0P0Y7W2_ORYSJ|nr:Os12g0203133 [Oryza sativa Japonica Group]